MGCTRAGRAVWQASEPRHLGHTIDILRGADVAMRTDVAALVAVLVAAVVAAFVAAFVAFSEQKEPLPQKAAATPKEQADWHDESQLASHDASHEVRVTRGACGSLMS